MQILRMLHKWWVSYVIVYWCRSFSEKNSVNVQKFSNWALQQPHYLLWRYFCISSFYSRRYFSNRLCCRISEHSITREQLCYNKQKGYVVMRLGRRPFFTIVIGGNFRDGKYSIWILLTIKMILKQMFPYILEPSKPLGVVEALPSQPTEFQVTHGMSLQLIFTLINLAEIPLNG